ncbi:MAG: hypothetical protein CME06_00280 [Gemmatimonadetes bacterium]|nr:hypothetical protein [Gemmatimonadota bacterium]
MNCIIADQPEQPFDGVLPAVTFSAVQGGWPGEGNLDEAPRLRDWKGYPYGLAQGSPCIDAGDGEDDSINWGAIDPRYINGAWPDLGGLWRPRCGSVDRLHDPTFRRA